LRPHASLHRPLLLMPGTIVPFVVIVVVVIVGILGFMLDRTA
jgi:hypothetical protein